MSQSELKDELLNCDDVLEIVGHHRPNVLKIKCNNATYALWNHMSKDFNQWYWSVQKCRLLSIDPPALIHAFLGYNIKKSYIIPHETVAGPAIKTKFIRKQNNEYWYLSAKNQREKLDQYSSVCEYFKQ